MTRHRSTGSHSHHIRRLGWDFEVSWVVDRYYAGSRLRFPRRSSRLTDEAGAKRFSKRHGVPMPV